MQKSVRIDLILIYYFIAVGLSAFFRVPSLNPDWYQNLLHSEYGWMLWRILRASGPLAGGVLCIWVFRNKYRRTITVSGTSAGRSILYYLAPVIMIAIVGVSGEPGQNMHYYGLLSGVTLMVYCLFEETGWRGFMQDAMRGIPNPIRFIIIGTLWYLWHLNFISAHDAGSLKFGLMIHLPSCILGSWGIGVMADKYKSLLVAAAIHSIFNIFFDLHAGLGSKAIIVAGVVILWITISWFYDRKEKAGLIRNPDVARDL